jgi:phage-related protein
MAISKDSLEVKITVENKEAQKSIKSINDTIDTLGNTTKYSNKEIMELDNKLSHVSNTTTEAVSSFDDLKKTINQAGNTQEITKLTKELEYLSNLQINKNIKPFAENINIANKTLEQYNKLLVATNVSSEQFKKVTEDTLPVVSQMGSLFTTISDKIDSISLAVIRLNELISIMTDPAAIKKVSNILFLLSKFSSFKGFDRLGSSLGSASDKLEAYNNFLIENNFSQTSITDQINKTADNLKMMETALEVAGVTGAIALGSITTATLKAAGASRIFQTTAQEIPKIMVQSGESAKITGSIFKDTAKIIGNVIPLSAIKMKEAFSYASNMANKDVSFLSATIKEIGFVAADSGKKISLGFKTGDFSLILKSLLDIFSSFGSAALQAGKTAGGLLVAGTRPFIRTISSEMDVYKKIFTTLDTSKLKNSLDAIGKSFSLIGISFGDTFKNSISTLKNVVKSIVDVKTAIGTAIDFTKNFGKHITSNMITAAEGAGVLGNAFSGIGLMLANSENGFIKFTGVILASVGVFLGGFNTVVTYFLGTIGDTLLTIGSMLSDSMRTFEEKFRKAQVSVVNFEYTMKGFGREFGDAIGTAEEWNKVINDISKNTLINAIDARKMSTEIIQVGSSIGLSKDQMMEFAKLIPNYVKAGDDAYEITVGFLQALTGMGQSVIKYGLHVSDAAVEHSKYAKAIGLSFGALTDEQKAQARMATIFEQAAAVRGRATEQLNTMAGAQQLLSNRMLEAQTIMGKQSVLLQTLYKSFAFLGASILEATPSLFSFLGSMQDALAVILKISGALISIALPMVTFGTILKGLNAIILANGAALAFMQGAINLLAGAIGVQSIAIVSLGTLLQNISILVKGALVNSLVLLGNTFLMIGVRLKMLAIAVLTNPLFWQAAAIVSSILLIVNGLKQIEEETAIFSDISKSFIGIFTDIGNSISLTSSKISIFSEIFVRISSFFAGMVASVIEGVYAIVGAFGLLTEALVSLTGTSTEGMKKFNESVVSSMTKLAYFINRSGEKVFSFGSVAYAAEAPLVQQEKIIDNIAKKLSTLTKELITATEKEKIFAEVLGTQAESLVMSKKLAEENLLIAKTVEDRKKYAQEIIKIDAEIIKYSRDASKEALAKRNEIIAANLDEIKSIGNINKKYVITLQKDLEPYQKQLNDLLKLPSTDETKKAIYDVTKTIDSMITQSARNQELESLTLKNQKIKDALDFKEQSLKYYADELASIKAMYAKKQTEATADLQEHKITQSKYKQLTELNNLEQLRAISEFNKAKEQSNYDSLIAAAQFTNNESTAIELMYQKKKFEANADLAMGKITAEKAQQIILLANLEQIKAYKDLNESKKEETIQFHRKFAELTDDQVSLAKISYEEDLAYYNKLLENKKMSDEEYIKVREALDKKRNKESGVLTGVETAQKAVDAVKGGVSSIISTIGAAFGPEGQLIASLINFLNMSKKEFADTINALLDGIVNIIPNVISNIPILIEAVLKKLPIVMKYLSTLPYQIIMMIPDILLAIANNIADIVSMIIVNTVLSIPMLIGQIIVAITKIIGKLPKLILDIFKGIIKGIVQIFSVDFWKNLFDFSGAGQQEVKKPSKKYITTTTGASAQTFKLQEIAIGKSEETRIGGQIIAASKTGSGFFTRAWEALKRAGRWLDENIWQPVIKFFKAVGSYIIDGFILAITAIKDTILTVGSWIWDGLKLAFELAAEYITAVGSWIWHGLKIAFEQAKDFIIAVGLWIWEGLKTAFTIAKDVVVAVGSWIWDGLVTAFTVAKDTIVNIGLWIWEGLKTAFNTAKDFIVALGGWIWEGIKSAFNLAKDFIIAVGAWIVNGTTEGFKKVKDDIIKIGSWIWDGVVTAFNTAKKAIVSIGSWIWDGMVTAFTAAKDALVSVGSWIWSGVVAGFTAAKDAIIAIGAWIWSGVVAAFNLAKDAIVALGSWIWEGVVKAFTVAKDALVGIGSWVWDGVTGAFTLAKDKITAIGSWIWDGLSSAFTSAKDTFSAAGTWIWNGLSSALSSAGNFLSKLFTFEGGGTGTVEKFLGFDFPWISFAEGGVVPGKPTVFGDSKKNDKVPAWLSPGEIVLPRSLTTDKSFMQWLSMAINEEKVPKYAKGFFGSIASGAKAIWETTKEVLAPVGDVISKVVEFVVPDWIQKLYDSITRYISSISIIDLVSDPKGTLNDAIKKFIGVFQGNFRQMMHFADGGIVPGVGSSDTVNAMLTPGEFVLNRNAVGNIGLPLLDRLNGGETLNRMVGRTERPNDVTINLTINTEQPIDQTFIKTKILPIIQGELKRGSIDGKRILATGGVR